MNIHTAETEIQQLNLDYELVRNNQDFCDELDALRRKVEELSRQPRYVIKPIQPIQFEREYNNWVEAAIHRTLDFLRW